MRLFLLILLLSGQMLAARVTIEIPFPGGVERIEFDDSKISQTDIRRIFRQLDPSLSGFSGYSIPNSLELCVSGDTKYRACGSGDIRAPNFLHNAEVNMQISTQRLRELEGSTFPAELGPVRAYAVVFFSSQLRLQRCRFEYYRNWNAAVLQSCDALEKAESCDAVLKKLEAVSEMEKYRVAEFDWYSCALRSQYSQLGNYPLDDWNKFLKAYGITEQEITNDD